MVFFFSPNDPKQGKGIASFSNKEVFYFRKLTKVIFSPLTEQLSMKDTHPEEHPACSLHLNPRGGGRVYQSCTNVTG